jgi:hypothetical protein
VVGQSSQFYLCKSWKIVTLSTSFLRVDYEFSGTISAQHVCGGVNLRSKRIETPDVRSLSYQPDVSVRIRPKTKIGDGTSSCSADLFPSPVELRPVGSRCCCCDCPACCCYDSPTGSSSRCCSSCRRVSRGSCLIGQSPRSDRIRILNCLLSARRTNARSGSI